VTAAPLVCWVVVNSVPYHEARARAAAVAGGLRICMVQLAEVDEFRVLQQPKESEAFCRYTLFPDIPFSKIRGREMVRRLWACLDQIGPAVVCINGWSFGGAIAALAWGVSRRVPAIVMSESTEIDDGRHWWSEAVKRRIIALCSAALVGGAPHRDYIAALGASAQRIFKGYDAVDNEHFARGAAAARQRKQDLRSALALPTKYFLACSRFSRKKNLIGLLEAYAIYRRLHGSEAWSLVIVGDGEARAELTASCDRLGLVGHVLLPGAKRYDELPIYYGLAGAFIHASTTEQWGLVVNEAMASGLPVLVSDRCGCAVDLVEEGRNGYLFDPYEALTLPTVMHRLAASGPALEDMGRTSQRIIARWSPETFATNLSRAAEVALSTKLPRAGVFDRLLLTLLSAR
jgi:glycosyltransferase involved in cell wall biosynthesis